MDVMDDEEFSAKEFVKGERERRIFAKVFDKSTLDTLHRLSTKGIFDVIEFVVSTGKEAHVFRAIDKGGNYRAIKIYKMETSDFKNMEKYIRGDLRFKHIGKGKRNLVYEWTKKEFKNLQLARDAGVRVPLPYGFLNNVLVMEFIGEGGNASKTLKETRLSEKDKENAYSKIVEWAARLYRRGLVHADLSEFNILSAEDGLVLIDIGQAVLVSHPNAREFFERDVGNVARYFSKLGLKKGYEEVYADIKKAAKRKK